MEDVAKETTQEETTEQTLEEKQDAFLDEAEKGEETAEDTTTSEETTDTETEEKEPSGTDPAKTEKGDEEPAKVPEEFHKHPAWQRIITERDEAKADAEKFKEAGITEDTLSTLNQTVNSREYIQSSMQAQGFTQDRINQELATKGFDVPTDQKSSYQLALDALNVTEEQVPEENRAVIRDISTMVDARIQPLLDEIKELRGLKDTVGEISNATAADKVLSSIEQTVKDEGVLDFNKDVMPVMNQWLQDNPEGTQEQFLGHFRETSRSMSLERLRTGKSRQENAKVKTGLRDNLGQGKTGDGTFTAPEKTGDKDADADAFLDTYEHFTGNRIG